MARTKKGAKGAGHDFWSKRPLSGEAATTEGKRMTNRIERRRRKAEVRKEVIEHDLLECVAERRANEIAQPVLRSMWSSSRGAERDLLRDVFIEGANWARKNK